MKGEEKIECLKIKERIKADHIPLEIELKEKVKKNEQEEQRDIMGWSEDGKKEYKRWLRDRGETTEWKEMKIRIMNAMPKKKN